MAENPSPIFGKIYQKKLPVGLLICTLIFDLRNQGPFQTLEKFKFVQTLIFFLGLHPEKNWVYTINQKTTQVVTLKKYWS